MSSLFRKARSRAQFLAAELVASELSRFAWEMLWSFVRDATEVMDDSYRQWLRRQATHWVATGEIDPKVEWPGRLPDEEED